ncbi:MAG: hypothetical protein KJ592_01475 [Nanoarchaeota archaeon]|nr:hypothetical protein [Nanoarchaeota archaeon]
MVKRSVWDWLAYVALGSVVVWVALRVLGVIDYFGFSKYYPYFVFVYVMGLSMIKLNHISYLLGNKNGNKYIGNNVWDLLGWFSLGLILVWLVLKSMGVI